MHVPQSIQPVLYWWVLGFKYFFIWKIMLQQVTLVCVLFYTGFLV